MRDKTGRPPNIPLQQRTYHDLERGSPVVIPDTVSYIYSGQWRVTSKTASFTLSNEMVVLVDASDVSIVLTLPAASSSTHKVYVIKKVDSSVNTVTIQGNVNTETIDGEISVVIAFQYQYVTIICEGSNWFVIGGEYVKMEQLLERQLDLLEEIKINTRNTVAQLELASDEQTKEEE